MKQNITNYETVSAVDALYKPYKPSKPTLNYTKDDFDVVNKHPDPIIYENNQNGSKQENWRYKLTIPEPFTMTIRDNMKTESPKPCKRVQNDLERTKQMEEAECRKVFRANPVPPTTFFPIYADMIQKDEIRRKMRKQHCREMTLAMQKPFDFYYREQVNKMFHSNSVPNLAHERSLLSPKHNSTNIRNREQRKKTSSAVTKTKLLTGFDFSIHNIRAAMKSARDWSRLVKWSLNQNKPVTPKRRLDPPDFTKIHSQLEKKSQNKLPAKLTTTCEPFALCSGTASTLSKVREDIRKDQEKLKENRWPFMAPRTQFGSSMSNEKLIHGQSSPPKLNLAAKLRAESSSKQMALKNEEENKNQVWKNALRRCVSAKIAAEHGYESNEERLKRKRADIKSQLVDYQVELNEIIKRVASRPLLMEQQTTMAARKRAEKIFLDKLHANGLTEEFIMNKSAFSLSDAGGKSHCCHA